MKKETSMKYTIGIDVGTSGTKTALFDRNGVKIGSVTYNYPLSQPHNGWAEQNPEDWYDAVVRGLRDMCAMVPSGDIAGVGLSGQMHGLVLLDRDGRVIRPSIIWCDQRTAEECAVLTELVGKERLMELTKSPAVTGFTASKILWVKRHEPENFARAATILLPKDYIRYRLSGVFATDVSDASGMQLLDIEKRDWSDEILEKLGLNRSMLGRVYESAELSARVSEEAAMQTGLAAGVPIAAGAGDNAASAIGCGVVRDGQAFVTIGTSGVVFAHTSNLSVDPMGRMHSFCSAVPGEYHVMGVTQAAGLSLQWFRNEFCRPETERAAELRLDPYVVMDSEAAEVPIGARGLLYMPYLMGERSPWLDPHIRGSFLGLSASHTRADLIRAVMEGVTYSLKDCLNLMEQTGVEIDSMMACGGGGSSPLWRQMLADVFGCEVHTAASNEGGALGAAILAMVASGLYSTPADACGAIVRYRTTQSPLEQNREPYARMYALYSRAYEAIAPLSHDLSKFETH